MKTPTCPCCSQLYSVRFSEYGGQPVRHPLLLRCGHTFCSACIHKLARKSKSIECPTCQKAMKVGSLQSLYKHIQPDLYTVGRMWMRRMDLEIQSEKIREKPGTGGSKNTKMKKKPNTTAAEAPGNEGGVGCTECHINTAVVQCIKCDCVLCRPCFDKIHQMSVTLKKHQPVKLMASVRPDRQDKGIVLLPNKTAARHCATHDQCEIEYFCEDDQQAICSRCVILGDHKGHNVQTMEDKNKQLLAEIEPAFLHAQETVWRLDKSLKVVQDAWPTEQHDRQNVAEEIHSHFSQLHSLLQAREEQLVDNISTALDGITKPFQDMKSHLEQERLKLESALMDAARARHSSLQHVVDTDVIVDTLQAAKDMPCVLHVDIAALSKNPLKFTCDPSLKKTISQYGHISTAHADQLVSLSVPGADAEKPPAEELRSYCVSDLDLDTQSNTDTASIAESVRVEEKEEEESDEEEEVTVKAEVVKTRPLSYPPVKRLVVGHSKQVYVTHIRTPGQFYIHLASQRAQLEQMQAAIQRYCQVSKTRRTAPSGLDKGAMVMAQFSEDKQWYRGRVTRVAKDKKDTELYDIFFVDYGNSELLPLQKLQKFQKRFFAPMFAHECSLYDIVPAKQTPGWTRESVETMVQMTCAGPLLMRVIKISGDKLQVDLGTAEREGLGQESCPVSVRDSLVFLQLAVFNTPSPQPSGGGSMKRDYITLPRLTEGSVTDIGINVTVSPSLFYAQMSKVYQQNSRDDSLYTEECHSYLQSMLVAMQNTYSDLTKHLYTLFCPRMDMMCVAKYHKDSNWYRARVTGLPGQRQVEVQFVDYGNKEIVAFSDVCNILDDYLKYPMQALEVSLADVKPVEGEEWSEEANQWFRSMVELQLCQFRVTENGTKANSVVGVLYTIRKDTGELCCVNYELVTMGFATSTGPWSSEESFTGITLLSNMTTNLSLSSGTPSPLSGSFHLGSPSLTHPQHAVDTKTTSPSRKPANKRGQGKKVKGSKIKKQPSPEKGGEGEVSCGVVPDGAVQVWISGYLSPAHFFIQLHDSQDDLNSLMEALQCYEGQAESGHQWKVGQFCAAKTSHDDRWYRGQILTESKPGLFEVRLVDYGHVDLIPANQLRALHRQHGERECFAERCHLANLVPTGTSDPNRWSQTATELMKTMMGRNRLFVKLQGDRLSDLGLPVDILVEQVTPETAFDPETYTYVSVSDTLQDKGLAMPVRRQKQDHPASPSSVHTHTTMFRTKPHTTLPQCGTLPPEKDGERSNDMGRECEGGTHPALDTQSLHTQTVDAQVETQAIDAQVKDAYIEGSQDAQAAHTWVKDTQPKDSQAGDAQPKDSQAGDAQPKDSQAGDAQSKDSQAGNAQPKDTRAKETLDVQIADTQAVIAPSGDTLAKEEEVTIVQPPLEVGPHPPPLSPTLSVLPVHVGPDGIIYAQDFDEEAVIAALRDDLRHYVASEAPDGRLEVGVGHMCLAYFTPDQVWYRARVLQVYPEHVTVKYVDFGNCSLVEKTMLRLITPALCAQPQLSYEMKLNNVLMDSESDLWPEKSIDFLNNHVLNVQCVANIEGSTDDHPLLVELYEGQSGQNVGRVMMEMDKGQPVIAHTSMDDRYQRCNDITDVLKKDNPYTSVSLGDSNTCVYAQVTHMDLPHVVYLQRCDGPEDERLPQAMVDFVDMMDDLNSLPPQTPALSGLPSAGHACCARFSEDDRWYRALVIRAWTEGSTVLVYYVDYGNSEVLPLARLRELPRRFLDTPAQAVQAHLHLALPAGCDRWTQETLDAMHRAIYMGKHRVMVKETKPVTVALYQREDGTTLSYAGLVGQGIVALPSVHRSVCLIYETVHAVRATLSPV